MDSVASQLDMKNGSSNCKHERCSLLYKENPYVVENGVARIDAANVVYVDITQFN